LENSGTTGKGNKHDGRYKVTCYGHTCDGAHNWIISFCFVEGYDMTEDDDDIQEYKKPWVGLTHEELCEIVGVSTNDSDWNVIKVQEWLRKVEAKLKEKNT
jgi:hypothetical protein